MTVCKEKKQLTIYHIHFFDIPVNETINPKDYYFGSISAIFTHFEKSQVGILASSLYNLNLDEIKNPIYENSKCRIRKSLLITKTKKGINKNS